MALAPGTRLGPYEIAAHLGAGGMGEVYRARDTRLDRTVALKISKEQFTPRFETEARATAALEHPHICRLYDICHDEGTSFLVMEYVEGTPLAGPLPLDRVLTYAGQIASALDEAHRKQIVHRDLKPSNVLVTAKGGVKLLDFGLAKLGSGTGALDDEALTRGLTAAGTIVGTLHYMSPEQLQGNAADTRSDIFAFGVVLYEMLTGKRAFEGASPASVIAAILERPAPSIATVAPSSLDRLLQRCLAKDPDERWQSARDVKAALDLITEPPIAAQPSPVDTRRRSSPWPWVGVGVLALGLAGLAFVHLRETAPTLSVVRFQVSAPDKMKIVSPPWVSPDGRSVAFVAQGPDGVRRIGIRRLDALDSRVLPGTDDASENVIWSPDSRWIAFAADRKLKTIEASGSGIRTIGDLASNISGGSWNNDGVLILGEFARGIYRTTANGGTLTQLVKPTGNEIGHVWPVFLPDGQRFIYIGLQRDRKAVAHVTTLDGVEQTKFELDQRARPTYVAERPGSSRLRLLSNRNDTIVAQRVDEARLTPVGEPDLVVDGVADATNFGAPGLYSVSSTGTLVYLSGESSKPTQLVWFDRAGKPISIVGPPATYNDLSLSPDETRVAVTRGDGSDEDLWLIDLSRNISTKFTFDAAQEWHAVWSPDGKRVAFSSTRVRGGTTNSVFWKDAGNVGNEDLVLDTGANERLDDWSPDGKLLLIDRTEGRDDLWIVPVAPEAPGGQRTPVPYLTQPGFAEARGQFFPIAPSDGRYWIVYTSNESGQNEIYLESYPRGAPKVQISTNGGTEPRWRRDGKELFYISPDQKLMAVAVTIGSELTFATPKELFQTRLSTSGTLAYRMLRYDVTRDGTRFLINTESDSPETSSNPITVLLNWTSLLKP